MRTVESRQAAHRAGQWAEYLAALVLVGKGYGIQGMRFKTPVGEIDLVARKGRTLVFVEVKLRKTLAGGLEAIHAKNRARVTRAAEYYINGNPAFSAFDIRFDAFVIAPPFRWRHVRGGWTGG